jgi:hypothetical protein
MKLLSQKIRRLLMRSFTGIILFAFSLYLVPVFANSESAEKAEVLCNCLKTAKKTDKASDKKTCLELREKQVKELGKNSPAYSSYVNLLSQCEREMMGISDVPAGTSYEEKVKLVCDCFQKEGKQNKPKCFKLQSELGKSFSSEPEKKKEFNLETSSCDK